MHPNADEGLPEERTMHYHEFEPHPDLVPYVWTYWTFSVPETLEGVYLHRVMPDGCVGIVCSRRNGGAHLVGPRLDAIEVPVRAGDVFQGIRFRPGAAGAFLGVDCQKLHGWEGMAAEQVPALAGALIEQLVPCTTTEDAARVLDALLLDVLPQAEPPDATVRAGVDAIIASEGQAQIREITNWLGLSERQFQRRFRQAVGLTPKQFARIRRFRASVGNVLQDDPDAWGRVAAERGFSDQAHLTREFNALYGAPPTSFEETVRNIDHGQVDP